MFIGDALCKLEVQTAKHSLVCLKGSVASKSRKVIVPFCSGETSPRVLHPALEPPALKGCGPVGASP